MQPAIVIEFYKGSLCKTTLYDSYKEACDGFIEEVESCVKISVVQKKALAARTKSNIIEEGYWSDGKTELYLSVPG